jgi:hypothetical protein
MKQRRNATPYLLTAKYAATCHCGKPVKAGDEAMYYPSSRTIECRDCATSTLSMLADEELMS